MEEEIWKDVVGYEGLYLVSNIGRVKRVLKWKYAKSDGILKLTNRKGYNKVVLSKDGIGRDKGVHRLVAEAFIPNPNNYPYINHINENKKDNRVENLEWCTAKYNTNYGTTIPRRTSERIKNNKTGKPVLLYTCDDVYLGEFANIDRCAYVLGLKRANLSKHIHENKEYHNFKFKFKN